MKKYGGRCPLCPLCFYAHALTFSNGVDYYNWEGYENFSKETWGYYMFSIIFWGLWYNILYRSLSEGLKIFQRKYKGTKLLSSLSSVIRPVTQNYK